MDRLLSSSSLPSLNTNLKPFTFLPRTSSFCSSKFNFLPSTRCSFRWATSISCKHENPSPLSPPTPIFASSIPPNNLPCLSSSQATYSYSSLPVSHPINQITGEDFKKPKAITARKFVILAALVMILIQPAFAPAAFATFQNAAKTTVGGKLISTELLSSAWTGFIAGCLHTLSGPDHLAALAPLSIGRTKMESAAVGALWGCGHDAGQVIFGLIFLLLKDRLHIEIIRTWGTRVVGITLLIIGAMGIREASEVPTPCVALENGECDVSVYESLDNPTVGKKKIGFATFATGIVHGLQPDALMMVLPALALPSRLAGAAFLIMFLLGTVVAMGSYTVFIGSCSQALKDRVPRITEKLTWASSLVAIALGFAILISQFFGFSLY
ncbi:chloroplast protein FOR GROWTH AND FERTILITY 2-like [Gastrolobium bilobum]|uniref:chloroplast protein FOR GROWTH AND FERTILITY 2-like n=1 Tax=Gastrolobium bilobum TaxID=150636 RepID=UPI002AAF1A4F|nr:chloroplast protein FOR GROWTH AND FERTILITY 2-like [Gastrolobium bilobum]